MIDHTFIGSSDTCDHPVDYPDEHGQVTEQTSEVCGLPREAHSSEAREKVFPEICGHVEMRDDRECPDCDFVAEGAEHAIPHEDRRFVCQEDPGAIHSYDSMVEANMEDEETREALVAMKPGETRFLPSGQGWMAIWRVN